MASNSRLEGKQGSCAASAGCAGLMRVVGDWFWIVPVVRWFLVWLMRLLLSLSLPLLLLLVVAVLVAAAIVFWAVVAHDLAVVVLGVITCCGCCCCRGCCLSCLSTNHYSAYCDES